MAVEPDEHGGAGGGAVPELGEQHRLAGLEPEGRGVGRRRPVDAETDMHTGGAQGDHRGDARRQDQIARRAVGRPDAGGAEAPDLVVGESGVRLGERHERSLSVPDGKCIVGIQACPSAVSALGVMVSRT